ncbi:MAG: hypothetical protein KAG97_01740 [Victivallales bacterium]|nr:hypothetical protein [Victivallales bacterium]
MFSSSFRYLIRLTLLSGFLSVFLLHACPAKAETVILADLVDDAQSGNMDKLVLNCGNLLAGGGSPEILAKAYAMLGIAYTLQDAKDAVGKCAGLLDLLPDDLLASPAVPLLNFFSGKLTKEALRKEMIDQPNDWKSVAALCELLRDIKTNAPKDEIKKGFKLYKESLLLVRATDWSAAWAFRIKLWMSWLRHGKGDPHSLEKLISRRKGESANHAQSAINGGDFVRQIVSLYLNGKIAEAKKKATEFKKAMPKTSFAYPVLDLLSGNNSITAESLFKATSKDAGLWALASLALFVVEVATDKTLDKNNLLYHLNNFETNVKAAHNDSRLSEWKNEPPKWRKWCESGFKSNPDLPILLQAKSVDGDPRLAVADSASGTPTCDITTITLKEFVESRKPYAKRPALVALQCSRKTLQNYFDTLPKELKRNELRRYKTIKSIKWYIIRILERNPYPYGLILKKRRKLKGIVTMANEKYLIYRKSNKSKRCFWKDLSYKQYAAFMKYYARERQRLKGGVGKLTHAEILANASDDYLGLAMLYDWHKKYKRALLYAKRAVKLNPKNKNTISAAMVP